jgi:dolichol-phosphate mannosyltransferase
LGYKVIEIPIEYRERVGTSKLHPITDGLRMIFGLLSVAWHETSPLGKMIIFPSCLIFIIGIGFGLTALYQKYTTYYLENEYFPMISVLFILLAVQLISIGLIIDYLAKKLDRIEEKIS